MPVKAIIIDDEYRARKALRTLCERFIPDLEILAEAEDVAGGLEAIRTHKPEVVFLDIKMPNGDGFSLIEENVLPDLYIIFTTAHQEYAIKALRVQAQDYLLKPIGVTDLEEAMARFRGHRAGAKESDSRTMNPGHAEEGKLLSLPTEEGMLLTRVSEVMYCEGVGAYTVFHLKNGRQVIVTRNLKKFEEQFRDLGFYRVHHSNLVNISHVAEVNSRNNFLLLKNGDLVNISQRKKAGFLKALRDLG